MARLINRGQSFSLSILLHKISKAEQAGDYKGMLAHISDALILCQEMEYHYEKNHNIYNT